MNSVIDFKTGKAVPFGPELLEKGKALMAIARKNGNVKIGRGVFLYDNRVLIENQKTLPNRDTGKKNIYTTAPFWIIVMGTAIGNSVSPCHTPQEVLDLADQDVIEAFTVQPRQRRRRCLK
jgi:hypothetical protein